MTEDKKKIAAPSITKDATDKLLRKMYISNVAKRLRELNAPTDVDRKRWVWELIQNAKDTIAGDSSRNEINVRIEIDGDTVKFRHDGNPFTADARFGLLYKYSEDKENQESTGRFGTGFLTTHCLSKIVTIESNMYSNEERTSLCGFSVTMYRDGQIEKELLEGLDKMQESEAYYENTFDWTTFTYHVSTESGRRAVKFGIENFHENIAQTMLFCKELASIELNDNGTITSIARKPIIEVANDVMLAEFEIRGSETKTRRFVFTSFSEYNKDLSDRYRADRNIRINAAIEIDSDNCIVNHSGNTSHFCVLPLLGIESQLDEPLILNSPDFEPDSERESLLLTGQSWNDENNNITETGINQAIYQKVYPLYDRLVSYFTTKPYGKLYLLANGLKRAKEHDKLDGKWYMENIIKNYREIILKYPVVEPYSGNEFKTLSECIIVKESKAENETEVFNLLSSLYPEKLIKDNHNWAQFVWKEGLNTWNTEDLCKNIQEKKTWNALSLVETTLSDWYNKFLSHVYSYDERLLKEYALLPNMNGDLLKKDTENFKQGEKVSAFIINLLLQLGKDVKPMLLHDDITAVTLDSKYNSQSYSADVNKLAKAFVDNTFPLNKLQNVLPLLSVLPSDAEKYKQEFITQRKEFFNIAKLLFSLTDVTPSENNNLLADAWAELDTWFVAHVLQSLKNLGELAKLPVGLDAKWLNDALKSLKVKDARLDSYEVLPNQNGKFCPRIKLFEDDGVPETLKVAEFDSISLTYKDILLHKDIEAGSFYINQDKKISSFASELKEKYSSQNSYSNDYPHSINGRHFKYPQSTLDKVALYVLSLIPSERETEVGHNQNSLYTTATNILGSEVIPLSNTISYTSKDLWQDANFFVVSMISNKIKASEKIEVLDEQLGTKGEVYVFEQLNAFYDFLRKSNISYSDPKIFPNQEGQFCSIGDLKKEEGKIDDIIKNIIYLLVDKKDDYRHILMDERSYLQPQPTLSSDNAYALIDEKVAELYKKPEKWKEDYFINAAQLLIEDWGDKHKGTFEEKFPRVFDEKEKILMNVVWKKERRELMMTVSNKLTEDQLKFVIENSAELQEFSDTNQKLSDENEELRKQNAELQRQLEIDDKKTVEEENEILKNKLKEQGIDNPLPEPVEVNVYTSSGNKSLVVKECQYSGLSSEEIVAYVSEAKMDVVNYFKELNERENLGMRFDQERIAMDSYSQLYGIYDRNGHELPLVVHSYKGPQYRYFDLNWYDWNLLSCPGSMLWVKTVTGLQCIPMYALPIRKFNISIGDNLSQTDQAKLLTLATVSKEYAYIGFEFGSNMPRNFTEHVAFDYVPEKLKECIGSIKQICDTNAPALAQVYNLGSNIPLLEYSASNYSLALQNMDSEETMREIHDLPANDMQAPVKGAGLESLL
jgi:hypothetical protein